MDQDKLLTIILSAAVAALVSVAVEYVKTRRAADFWLAQEQLRLKRETYSGLLETLAEVRRRAEQMWNVGTKFGPEDERDRKFLVEAAAQVGELRVRLDKLASVAVLWLGPEALAALRELDKALTPCDAVTALSELDHAPMPWNGTDALGAIGSSAARAIEALLAAARSDLRLR